MKTFESLQAMQQCVGQEIGVSDWVLVDQARIDKFAEATGDFNWAHVDPARAAKGPFGKTIAHGFLTLSLLPMFTNGTFAIDGVKLGLNYGLNKVRFPAPVPVDSRVRGRVVLKEMEAVAPVGGNPGFQVIFEVTVECDGATKPVCIAESVQRRYA
jgi:acyl dehydratase